MRDSWVPLPPKRILVASDLAARSDEAIREAAEWGRMTGAALVACHVVVPNPSSGDPLSGEPQPALHDVVDRARQGLAQRLARMLEATPPDGSMCVEVGDPRGAIIELAEKTGVDLVVIGDRGDSGVLPLGLGSTAEAVVRYAHCPVLVARPHRSSGRVLAATDLSDRALSAVVAAAFVARKRRGRLTIVHAIEGGRAATSAFRLAEQRISEIFRRLEIEGDVRVSERAATTAILQAAEELEPELLAMATHGRTGLARAVLGSVAEAVVRRARCPVLVVRSVQGVAP